MKGEMTQNDFDATMAVPDPVMEITCSTSTDDTMASVPPDAYGTTVYRTMYFRIRRRAPNVVAALKFSFSALQGYSDVIDSSPKLGEQLIWNEHNGIMLQQHAAAAALLFARKAGLV